MVPLLLFAYARLFIDVSQVTIPYGDIILQLVMVITPVIVGLGIRIWKPLWANKLAKLTRPIFWFFILFFLTYGIYINMPIFRLLSANPIVVPASGLLPWIGFSLSGLIAYLLRQKRAIIISIAIETGIQNVGVAILVLLFSMPQPFGDMGALMPIFVSLLTPVPLILALLGITIRRRCSGRPRPSKSIEVKAEATPLKVDPIDDEVGENGRGPADQAFEEAG